MIAATLAITPLRKLLHLPDLIRFRRMLGLYAFFYASLHFLTYLWLDRLFDFHEIVEGHRETRRSSPWDSRRSCCMLPLAITSTKGWIRRLGGKRWQLLHRLVYFSGIAAVIHYYWLVKSDFRLPYMYGAIIGVLLLYRVASWVRG